jgi:hypothetical protein
MNPDVGEGADRATGVTVETLGVAPVKPERVAMEEEEFERLGLGARTVGVGKVEIEGVEGEGREWRVEWRVVGAGPGWTSPSSPGSKMTVEQNPSVDVMINIFPSVDLTIRYSSGGFYQVRSVKVA